jgi:hypothetical protein
VQHQAVAIGRSPTGSGWLLFNAVTFGGVLFEGLVILRVRRYGQVIRFTEPSA